MKKAFFTAVFFLVVNYVYGIQRMEINPRDIDITYYSYNDFQHDTESQRIINDDEKPWTSVKSVALNTGENNNENIRLDVTVFSDKKPFRLAVVKSPGFERDDMNIFLMLNTHSFVKKKAYRI